MNRLATILLPLVVSGCLGTCEGIGATNLHLHHDYHVRDSPGGLVLDCKLSGAGDPVIGPEVTAVEWDAHAIVAKLKVGDSYIVKATELELECGKRDSVYGPFSDVELAQMRNRLGLAPELGKKEHF